MIQRFLMISLIFLPCTLHPMNQFKNSITTFFSIIGAATAQKQTSKPKLTIKHLSSENNKLERKLIPQKLTKLANFTLPAPQAPSIQPPTISIHQLTPQQLEKHVNFTRPLKNYFKK